MLEELGCVDALCFGSETGDLDSLWRYARLFEEEPPLYRETLQSYLKQGSRFPAARSRAGGGVLEQHGADSAVFRRRRGLPPAAAILDSPNNILGVEYLRAPAS